MNEFKCGECGAIRHEVDNVVLVKCLECNSQKCYGPLNSKAEPVAEVPCSAGLCPHCGYDVFSDTDPFAGCPEKGWYIICPDCIACGPIAETKMEAERLFRKRA